MPIGEHGRPWVEPSQRCHETFIRRGARSSGGKRRRLFSARGLRVRPGGATRQPAIHHWPALWSAGGIGSSSPLSLELPHSEGASARTIGTRRCGAGPADWRGAGANIRAGMRSGSRPGGGLAVASRNNPFSPLGGPALPLRRVAAGGATALLGGRAGRAGHPPQLPLPSWRRIYLQCRRTSNRRPYES